jgi:hypothetical protein
VDRVGRDDETQVTERAREGALGAIRRALGAWIGRDSIKQALPVNARRTEALRLPPRTYGSIEAAVVAAGWSRG